MWVLCSGLRVSKVVDSAVGYLTEEQTLHTRSTAEKSLGKPQLWKKIESRQCRGQHDESFEPFWRATDATVVFATHVEDSINKCMVIVWYISKLFNC